MIGIAKSKNEVAIRLTEERWYHIVEHHEDLAGYAHQIFKTIEDPNFIVKGWLGEFLAVREQDRGKYLVVVYREISKQDGFIISAYFTKRLVRLRRRPILWQKRLP